MCCKPLGATTDPQPLDSGQGQTWLAGRIVLKPAGMATEVRWRATVLAAMPDTGRLRIARPVAADQQLVHGDLLGHVPYEPGQPPVIIDWVLYWRPVPWAAGVAVADALCWHGADEALINAGLRYRVGDRCFCGPCCFACSPISMLADRHGRTGGRTHPISRL